MYTRLHRIVCRNNYLIIPESHSGVGIALFQRKGTSIHVWFGTTGKKNQAIKKIGKGHYRLQGK